MNPFNKPPQPPITLPKKEQAKDPAYTPWDEFDPIEYVERNYVEMLPEDAIIIQAIWRAMKEYGIKEGQFDNAADVGAGPNLYPAMLLEPYVKGRISLIEYAASNRQYLQEILGDNPEGKSEEHKNNWIKYGEIVEDVLDQKHENIFDKVKSKVDIQAGSIYDLPKEQYSAVSSFFVPESITDKPEEFSKALNSLIDSLKPGGVFVVAHMVGSEGYYAGEGTKFPAVKLSVEDLENAYRSNGNVSDFRIERAEAKEGEKKVREGYHGMVVVIGRRKS